MAYNNSIPQPSDQLSQSQQDLLENFIQLQNAISENHVALAAAGQGKHTHVVMVEQGADPGTGANEVALYSKDVGGATHLFFQPENAGTALDLSLITNAGSVPNGIGYFYLTPGLLVQWGWSAVASGNTSKTVDYVADWGNPAFSAAPYAVAVTPIGGGLTNDFVVYCSGSTAADITVLGFARSGSAATPVPNSAGFSVLLIGPA